VVLKLSARTCPGSPCSARAAPRRAYEGARRFRHRAAGKRLASPTRAPENRRGYPRRPSRAAAAPAVDIEQLDVEDEVGAGRDHAAPARALELEGPRLVDPRLVHAAALAWGPAALSVTSINKQ
jgi:hypothetical protein